MHSSLTAQYWRVTNPLTAKAKSETAKANTQTGKVTSRTNVQKSGSRTFSDAHTNSDQNHRSFKMYTLRHTKFGK